jgi:hypothetical protein
VSLGWFVDHQNRIRRDIVGSWYYPTPDVQVLGYSTTLDIRLDGTFTKTQVISEFAWKYDGTYTTNNDGTVTFHVAKRTMTCGPPHNQTIAQFNHSFRCRCGVDRTGYLVIDDYGSAPFGKNTRIQWETYMPQQAK